MNEKNILHLDLKSSNIFVSGSICKIGDFGFSQKFLDNQSMILKKNFRGSKGYYVGNCLSFLS